MSKKFAIYAALAWSALAIGPALAQAYPTMPIRLIVPTAPGGGYDLMGRLLAEKLSAELGQPWVVENRTGAGALVGTQAAAAAPPDGYTLVMGGLSNIAFSPGLYEKLPYNPSTDFVPVAIVCSFSYTLVARKDLPATNLKELVELARAKPDALTIATAGPGTGQHVAAALLAQLANVKLLEVPYKGAQPAYTDLFGGRVDLFFDNTTTVRPILEGNRLKALAISSRTRDPALPQVPTGQEAGMPGLVLESWIGIFAPAKTPKAAIERLRTATARVMQSPEMRNRVESLGFKVTTMTPSETERFVKAEIEKWPPLLRRLGIKAD